MLRGVAGRATAVALGIVVLLVGILALAMATGTGFGSGLGGWASDGLAPDSFWDTSMIDLPGLSLYAVHCHGQSRYDFQIGATGPKHGNPCYAARGLYSGAGEQVDTLVILPGGTKAVYRRSVDFGPWSYYIGDVIYAVPPPSG